MGLGRPRLTRKVNQGKISAEEYREQEQRRTRCRPTHYRPHTRLGRDCEWKKWQQHCLFLELGDPLQALSNASPNTFVTYLDWRCEDSSFENLCRSTVDQYWKRLSSIYRDEVNSRGTSVEVQEEVSAALGNGGHLQRKHGLIIEAAPKGVVGIDDFIELLSALWHTPLEKLYFATGSFRATLWLFKHVAGYTGSRPGALVDNSSAIKKHFPTEAVGEFDTIFPSGQLLYKHCKLTQYPAGDGGQYGDWVLEISLEHVKGGIKTGAQPVTYLFHTNPSLALCPIMSFLTVAFTHGAFEVEMTPAQLFDLRIHPDMNQCEVTFKACFLDTPVFRNDAGSALTYGTLRNQLLKCGRVAGFKDPLKSYCLRRGFANAIHGQVSTSVQNQALSHNHDRVFQKYYQNRRLGQDVQNIFIGLPGEDRLLKMASAMRRTQDKRRPTKPNDEDRRQAQSAEQVQSMRDARDEVTARCKQLHGSVKASRGTDAHEEHRQAVVRYESAFRKALRKALEDRQERHDHLVAVNDVKRQVHGPSCETVNEDGGKSEGTNEGGFVHPLRKRVAEALFATEFPEPRTAEDIARRVSVLTDLLELSSLHSPHYLSLRPSRARVCANPHCKTERSTKWRENDGGMLCNTCNCYYRRHKKHRPPHLVHRQAERERAKSDIDSPSSSYRNDTEDLFPLSSPAESDGILSGSTLHEVWPTYGTTEYSSQDLARLPYGGHPELPLNDHGRLPAIDEMDLSPDRHPSPPGVIGETSDDADTAEPFCTPTRVGPTQCLFCLFEQKSYQDREAASHFASYGSVQRHVESLHLHPMRQTDLWTCPDPSCWSEVLVSEHDFHSHAATRHGMVLTTGVLF